MITFTGYQALSHRGLPNGPESFTTHLRRFPDSPLRLDFSLCDDPPSFEVAQFRGRRLTPGAFEYIDLNVVNYLRDRWPYCLKVQAQLDFKGRDYPGDDLLHEYMKVVRFTMWGHYDLGKDLISASDRATVSGYRREFLEILLTDILRNFRQTETSLYADADIGEPIGPGFILVEKRAGDDPLALVWSQTVGVRGKTNFDEDRAAIRSYLAAQKLEYNAYAEMRDAKRLLAGKEIKSAVRSAAAAAEAMLKNKARAWNTGEAPRHLPFNEKIDWVTNQAGFPPFSATNPAESENILYLYRCRSSMHEGDCFYDDLNGERILVYSEDAATRLLSAGGEFLKWMSQRHCANGV